MKVKVKFENEKKILDVIDLEDLHSKVRDHFSFPEIPILSLNKTDPLPEVGAFTEHDIVHGKYYEFTNTNDDKLIRRHYTCHIRREIKTECNNSGRGKSAIQTLM